MLNTVNAREDFKTDNMAIMNVYKSPRLYALFILEQRTNRLIDYQVCSRVCLAPGCTAFREEKHFSENIFLKTNCSNFLMLCCVNFTAIHEKKRSISENERVAQKMLTILSIAMLKVNGSRHKIIYDSAKLTSNKLLFWKYMHRWKNDTQLEILLYIILICLRHFLYKTIYNFSAWVRSLCVKEKMKITITFFYLSFASTSFYLKNTPHLNSFLQRSTLAACT